MENDVTGQTAVFSLLGHKGDLLVVHFRNSFDQLKAAELAISRLRLSDYLEQTTSYLSVVELGLYDSSVKLYRTLREQGCPVPVLMLTARAQVPDRVHGLDAGADDYLTKPFDFQEMLARVRALVRRGPAPRAPRLHVGDLVVDTATHAVHRAGEAVELTAREFALLEYLARHAGDVVTRTDLIEHVWDANFEGSTNIVDVYVGYLRRKLEQPFQRALIHTVRGVGFKLEPDP